ncbi:2-isopropylmalate synthase [Ectobacillus funiculus]|uniref:2-isopropylmalate synthase n=1 Tax=Ectobacillus funiculus TaxID=137993 RepID=UPI00397CE04A
MKDDQNNFNEEFAQEISPGSRQDVWKEEGSKLSPLFPGLAVFIFILLLLLSSLR